MLILDLWGLSFHAMVAFGLGKNLLFKSVLGHCGLSTKIVPDLHGFTLHGTEISVIRGPLYLGKDARYTLI